jgi:hypothetical protein
MLLDLKIYYGAILIKEFGTGIKTDRQPNGTNREPEINTCILK